MQQIICFFVSVFLFSGLFISSTNSLLEKQHCRIAKQNLNLSGRDVINYITSDEGRINIHEKEYLDNLDIMIGIGEIIGGIFYYKDNIFVLKKGDGEKGINIDISFMNDTNKRNTINNLVDYLLEKDDVKTAVNIAVENEEDYLTENLFNKLEENTAFIIGKIEKNVFLSGFTVGNA